MKQAVPMAPFESAHPSAGTRGVSAFETSPPHILPSLLLFSILDQLQGEPPG
jgi:hypothetical protein